MAPLTVVPVPGPGAEDIVVAPDGTVYTGTEDGAVFAIKGQRVRRVGHTGGRPLGLELLADGRLLVCDAHRGLLALDPGSGALEALLADLDGARMVFCNNAAVAADGTIYFTDSSRVHSIEHWKNDMVEDTCSGRLAARRPDGSVEVMVDGLRFANGVALGADQAAVYVAETTARDVVRRWVAGPRAGESEPFVENLPGYPDNIARGSDGLIWVTIASPTDPVLALLWRLPVAVRRLVLRLPERVQPKPKRTVHVMAFAESGETVHDLRLDASTFHMVTGVREHEGRVWLGSLHEAAVAYFDL